MPATRLALALQPLLERIGARGTGRLVTALTAGDEQTVEVRLSTGVRMRVDLGDRVQRLMAYRMYERRELDLVRALLRPGDTFVDCGAHVGYYTLHAARAVGTQGQVHAFEPAPANVARLRENVALNGARNLIVHEAAVSAASGRTVFQLVDEQGETGWGSLMLAPGEKTRAHEVDVVALDDVLDQMQRVALMKLDVQGSELDALRGAARLLDRDKPHVLCEVVEAWWGPSQTTTTKDLFAFMASHGYRAYGLPLRGEPVAIDAVDPAYLNVLFTTARAFPGRY